MKEENYKNVKIQFLLKLIYSITCVVLNLKEKTKRCINNKFKIKFKKKINKFNQLYRKMWNLQSKNNIKMI